MTPNILHSGSTAVDATARSAATAAQTAATDAKTTAEAARNTADAALSGAAHDEFARTALAAVGTATTNDWGIGSTLAAGVTEMPGSGTPDGIDIGLKSLGVGSATGRFATVDVAATAFGSGAIQVGASTLDGTASLQQMHTSDQRGVFLADQTSTPALTAGTTLWLHLPKVMLHNETVLEVHLFLEDGNGSSRGVMFLDLPNNGLEFGSWASGGVNFIGDHITQPTINDISITDLGGGIYDVKIPYAVTTNTPTNWGLYICTDASDDTYDGDGSDIMVEFVAPVVIPDSTDATWPADGVAGWEVADPSVGTHRQAVPLALAVVAAAPTGETTGALEIVGTNAQSTAGFVSRLNLTAAGEPQLYLSEDAGATSRTMTLPVEQWTAENPREIALLVLERAMVPELVLAFDRVVVTGIAIGEMPTIATYRTCIAAASAVYDATGLSGLVDGGFRASTSSSELAAVTQIPGLHYVELEAS